MLVLDEATAVFSLDRLPQNVSGLPNEDIAWLIGGEDGVLHAMRLIGNDLNVFVRRHPGCSNDGEWVLEKQLDLLEATARWAAGARRGLFRPTSLFSWGKWQVYRPLAK
jgi:hypothetical protein